MSPLTVVLALVVGGTNITLGELREGPNGLNLCDAPGWDGFDGFPELKYASPAQGESVYVIHPEGNEKFVRWANEGKNRAKGFMRYFVACAFAGVSVRYDNDTWRGRFGLAPDALRGKMTELQRRAVSACLLAHVNVRGTAQYVSFQSAAQSGLPGMALSDAEEWVMGFTEGVFAGDLWNPSWLGAPLFTYSLVDSVVDCGRHGRVCVPLLQVLGRTVAQGMGRPKVCGKGSKKWLAEYEGRYSDELQDFSALPPNASPPFEAYAVKPHWYAGTYVPVFTRMPSFVNAEAFKPASDGDDIEVLSVGGSTPVASQVVTCQNKNDCIGGSEPGADPKGKALANLSDGQILEVVIRKKATKALPTQDFAAIVRFQGTINGQGVAFSTQAPGPAQSWKDVPQFAPAGGWVGADYEWMHFYPLKAVEERMGGDRYWTLRVWLRGSGDGKLAPNLDAIGFISQAPYCCEEGAFDRPDWCNAPVKVGVCPRPPADENNRR